MSEQITFSLPGKPAVWTRPRFNRKTGSVFTDKKAAAAQNSIVGAYLARFNRAPHPGPVSISIMAVFGVPKSWPKWQRQCALAGMWPHVSTPDHDNITKAVCDALNGIAYTDDSQIVECHTTKGYGVDARTSVMLTLLDSPTKPQTRKEV